MGSDSMQRRRALRLLAAAPLGAALSGCGERVVPPPSDAGGATDAAPHPDGGRPVDGGAVDAGVCEPTTRDALGPFYEDGAPTRMRIAASDEPGDPLLVEGSIVDAADCRRPLSGYVLDVWQADANGRYYDGAATDYRLRGRLVTAADGRFSLETVKPGYYETASGPRPAHLHVRVHSPEGAERLVTQLYFEGDPYLGAADGCQPPTCFSNDPGRIMSLEPARVGGRPGLASTIRLVVPI